MSYITDHKQKFDDLKLRIDNKDQWKKEANEAIKKLEELTGNEFVIDSVKTQYDKPSATDIENEKERLNNGYYSEESKNKKIQWLW